MSQRRKHHLDNVATRPQARAGRTRRVVVLFGAAGMLLAACGSDTETQTIGVTQAVEVGGTDVATVATEGTTTETKVQENTTTVAVPAEPEVIYDSTDRGIDGAETSQLATETAELPAIVYHPVSPEAAATVNGIEWQGIYCDVVEGAPAPEPHATGFVISLHSDNNGKPTTGDDLWSATFDAGEVNQTFDKTNLQPCGEISSTWAYYNYSATLQTPFDLEASQTYWLSIQAITPNLQTFWGWRGAQGTGSTFQDFNGELREITHPRSVALLP